MGFEDDIKKVLDIVNKIDGKLDTLSARISALEASGVRSGSAGAGVSAAAKKPSDIADEQKQGPAPEPVEGRAKCPKCGSINITQREDRSKAISYSGGIAIYGKKSFCKQCSHEWF